MRKQQPSDSERLSSRQVTPQDLVTFVETLSPGVERFHSYTTWRSGYKNFGHSLDEFRDPSKFEDFADVDYLSLTFYYGDDDRLEVTFGDGTARVRWTGVVAADKARRFRRVWEAVPSDQVKPSRWMYVLRNSLAAGAFITWALNTAALFLPHATLWWIGILSLCLAIGWFVIARRIMRMKLARPSRDQPFMLERPTASQWSDTKHRTSILVAVAGIIVGVLGSVASVVVTLVTAKG